MSYSRRQLEAFGEPLGDSATRKEAGRIIYGGGGGGGGAPATQTQITDVPDWAKPYAEDTLKRTKTLTQEQPYKGFGQWAQEKGLSGETVAGPQALQTRAYEGIAGMGPSAATGQGIGIAGQAAGKAMGTSYGAPAAYDPYATGQFGAQASQYMDPYMQNVVGIQQREAQRTADIAGTQRGAQAVQSGAFGGSRQAIMEAEAARNLATQKGDIQARGLQDAYGRGQTQFNTEQALREQSRQYGTQLGEQSRQYGAGLGLQGLQTALTGAGQLGALGQQQFGQGMDVNKLQQAYGTQQQQLEQQKIAARQQEYGMQEKYPYQQLEFMSSIMRGTPMGTVQSLYAPPPSAASQALGFGTAALGASQLMRAEGGTVRSYASGGLMDLAIADMMGDQA